MIKTGLLSVTFRQLQVDSIVQLVEQAGLDGIEWGGDIHVPHGDLEKAVQVRRMCEEKGITIVSYGSYYRTGVVNEKVGSFEKVLETAVALGAPLIRVWAGDKSSEEADAAWRDRVAKDARNIADLAAAAGVEVCFEYHGNTLTDTAQSARQLMQEVNHPNMYALWQPPVGISFQQRLAGLADIQPWLKHMHVFYWHGHQRQPLSEGQHEWFVYLKQLAACDGEHYAMLEFVKNDAPEQFLQDAANLKVWVDSLT